MYIYSSPPPLLPLFVSSSPSSQVDALQSESRKRIQSESDIKKSQEKVLEELQTKEQKMLEQVRELRQDNQRLEDTIYRLKTEAMATNVSQQKLKDNLAKEREAAVRGLRVGGGGVCTLIVAVWVHVHV